MSTNTRARQQCIAFGALYVSQMTKHYSKTLYYSMYMYSYILEFEFFLLNSLLFNAHNYVTYLSRI